MEIDIPDLNDVEFEDKCTCVGDPWAEKPPKPGCKWCGGKGTYLTIVGEKLVKFLKARGIHLVGEDS